MAMKKKYEIEEEISRLEKDFEESSKFISNGILEGRTDLQVNIDNRAKIKARLMTLQWVLNKNK
jgi:hypothetical protein